MSSLLSAIGPLHEALNYHLSRHSILTSNLAHVDTPNYRPRDLYRVAPFQRVLETSMEAEGAGQNTGGQHLAQPSNWEVKVDRYSPVGADGNAVSLDREAAKIASNNLRYDAIATMIQGQLSSLQWAATDGR